jgi:hypothetical protein
MGSRDRILVKSIFFFYAAIMLLFYTKNYLSEVSYFPRMYNRTSSCGPTASGANVDPTSQVCSPAMLVLPIVDNCKLRFQVSPQWHNVHTKFHPNPSSGSPVESRGQRDRRTDMTSPTCVHFMHIMQRTRKNGRLIWYSIIRNVHLVCLFCLIRLRSKTVFNNKHMVQC